MKILHLSDLHLTGDNTSFDDIWHGPAARVEAATFDYVIVSGDLSQRASVDEYAALHRFLESDIEPLLRDVHRGHANTRARVIVVPGNHDVDWSASIGERVSLASLSEKGSDALRRQLAEQRAHPGRSKLRQVFSGLGHLEFFELALDRYSKRFANVETFLRGYYAGVPDDALRPFALLGDEREQWSAHVFPGERVAFFGFNSCVRNDRYWTGAELDAGAVASARRFAEQLDEQHDTEFMRVAVWHHGLASEQGRPDALTLKDIGLLYNSGFRVGFHGHTHRAASEVFDNFLRDRFVMVATGSLGAGSIERPDAVGNQFSVVRLHPGQVDVELFEREGLYGEYRPKPRRLYIVRGVEAHASEVPRCSLHERAWTVGADGIARAEVTLTDYESASGAVIALITPPFCSVEGDTMAHPVERELTVRRDELPDGRVRFQLDGGARTPRCTWAYSVSNKFALSRADLGFRKVDRPTTWRAGQLRDDEEAHGHTVRIASERLVLRVRFEQDGIVVTEGTPVRALVERRVERDGLHEWNLVEAETTRCHVVCDAREASLEVEAPLLDHRYTLAFRLAREGASLSGDAARAARDVLDRCRGEHGESDGLSRMLTGALDTEFVRRFGSPLGARASWIALLWNAPRRRLFSAFGRFSQPSWNARFAAGAGVAGHVFRFGRPAFWHRAHQGAGSALIYQRLTELQGPYQHEYEWVACFPIRNRGGAPIGVVSFAGEQVETQADGRLAELAAAEAGRENRDVDQRLIVDVQTIIDAALWGTLAQPGAASPSTQEFARAALDSACAPDSDWPVGST